MSALFNRTKSGEDKMAKQTKDTAEKHARTKSTGTINLLVETRRQASDQYMRAQRAETAYRTRKNATIARTTLNETKTHFKEGFSHFGAGFKGLFSVLRATPYLVGERREQWRRKSDAKNRQRAEEQRKKLDEKIAREYADVGSEEGADEQSTAGSNGTGKGNK
ncbi:hypothetical protein GGR57DRAFT_320892 [Xylariaceae sp. FL1272]|nr:hypothetical protein GGR57DRAFT_320892 [Xylariaceae sp. FL1272]